MRTCRDQKTWMQKSFPSAGFSLFLKRKKTKPPTFHLFKRGGGRKRQLEESEGGVSCDVPPHSRASDALGTESFHTAVTVLSPYEVVMDVPISHMGRAGPQRHLSLAQVRIIKSAGGGGCSINTHQMNWLHRLYSPTCYTYV